MDIIVIVLSCIFCIPLFLGVILLLGMKKNTIAFACFCGADLVLISILIILMIKFPYESDLQDQEAQKAIEEVDGLKVGFNHVISMDEQHMAKLLHNDVVYEVTTPLWCREGLSPDFWYTKKAVMVEVVGPDKYCRWFSGASDTSHCPSTPTCECESKTKQVTHTPFMGGPDW